MPQTPGCHNITAATVTCHTKSHASGTCESDNSFHTFRAVYLFEYQSTYNFSSAQNFVLIIQMVRVRFAFERVQNTFNNFRISLNPERNHRSGSGQQLNPNPKLAFGPVRFGFGPRFRTEPSHHYAGQALNRFTRTVAWRSICNYLQHNSHRKSRLPTTQCGVVVVVERRGVFSAFCNRSYSDTRSSS